jgi:hypothetical protein
MSARPRTRPLLSALALLALATAGLAQAAQRPTTATATATSKKTPSASVKFIDAPSSESPVAREKRLKRECRGRPNAGMCLGYTH